MGKAIAYATPVFFALIALEFAIARARGMPGVYRLNDAINSLSLGVMSQVTGLFVKLLTFGIYAFAWQHVAVFDWPDAWWGWVLAVVFYDFCYYWNHRLGHESAVFWAAHVVHHQSQCYNLSTALRQTSSGALLGWIFYLPMAVAGVPPEMFVVAALVDLLYQYWIHTEVIGKLGWFDRWFASPSNHRVHHAVNDRYIDRNYGGIFMVWDRMFGTFVEESERCVYGTRAPLQSWDPLWANLEVYADLARKSRQARRWRDRLLFWIKPPGWQPQDFGPKPVFDIGQVATYDPPMSAAARTFATLQLTLAIVGSVGVLWYSDSMPQALLAVAAAAVVTVLWLTGAVMQGRLALPRALAIEGAALLAVLVVAHADAAPLPAVVDDARVQRAVASARSEFLAQQPFDRMHVTVLLEDRHGTWRRGAVEGDRLAYPASSVKLGFLVGAVHWCREQGRGPDCLDAYARPMIETSDNVATGEVVDRISGVANGPVDGADLAAFIERRRYTERVLDQFGLLGPQRLFTKTYPTNSGEEPQGLEHDAWKQVGRNAMTTDLAARLMLGVATGTIEPAATTYMRALLRRPAFTAYSSLGGGLPPGSLHENKIGSAFDTLQDVMYAELPDGQRLVIAAFTNGWDAREPPPWDVARLGDFTARLLRHLGLDDAAGQAPRVVQGERQADGSARWQWRVPRAGRYQVTLWFDAAAEQTRAAAASLADASGNVRSLGTLDQSTWGRRWIHLGDVDMVRGAAVLTLQPQAPGPAAAGTLRVAAWPAVERSP